jgi:hypothetical protein
VNKPSLPPLVIHHTGFLPYLPFCVQQAVQANPGREVILLGDEANRMGGIVYRHERVSDYGRKTPAFLQAYRHITRSDFHDERRCLERWFFLSDFLETAKIGNFYFLDSDYLLFADLSRHESRWLDGEAAGTPLFWGFAYFRSPALIHGFCDWLLELYRDDRRLTEMRNRYEQGGSQLQEMGFIREYCREAPVVMRSLNWGDTQDSETWDEGFFGSSYHARPEDFAMIRQPEVGGPVWFWREQKKRRLLGVHFVGHAKNQIPGFTGWTVPVARAFLRPNYRRNVKFLCQYLWHGRRCRAKLALPDPARPN